MKTKCNKIYVIVFTVAMLAGATQNAFTATITNGGFETGDFTAWSVVGNVTVGGFSEPCCFPSEGAFRADFNGGNQNPNGQLSQSFVTIVGAEYFLSFDFAKGGTGSGTASLNIQLTGLNVLLNDTISDNTGGLPGVYSSFDYTFIADDTSTILSFTDASTGTIDFDALLDNVSISSVPIPAAIWLFGSGLVLLFGLPKGQSNLSKLNR